MLSLAAMLAMVPVGVRGADVVWDNGSADSLWVTPSNWDGDAVPTGADNVFLGAPGGSITVPSGAVAGEMTVEDSYSLSTGDLTLGGRLWVAPTAGGNLSLVSGMSLTAPSATVGIADGSSGGALVVSAGTTLDVTGNLGLGYGGTGHNLTVDGTANVGSLTVGGETVGSKNNVFMVSDTGVLTSSGTLMHGYKDSNNLGVLWGAMNTASTQIGVFSTSTNNAIGVAPGGTWTDTDSIIVGLGGSNNQLVNNGTISMTTAGKDFVVGHDAGANDNVATIDSGATLSINGGLYAGKGGSSNEVNIGDINTPGSVGTVTSTVGRIGSDAGSNSNTVTVANAGSSWTLTGALRVGGSGSDNELLIRNGGVVSVTGDKNVWVGYADNSASNSISVQDGGSLLDVQGTGEITLSNGGVPASGFNVMSIASGGHVNAAKVNLAAGSALILGQDTGSPMGTLNPATVITGNGTGDFIDPSAGASIVAVFQVDPVPYTLANQITGSTSVFLQSDPAARSTTILSGANSYTGSTLVAATTLQLSGVSNNIASSHQILLFNGALDVTGITGGFSLGSAQRLEGLGTVTGDVTAPSGSTIRGGAEIAGPATLTFANNLIMQGGSNLNVSLFADNPVAADQTNAGSLWSMVQVDGTISLSGLDVVPLAINLESGGGATGADSTWAILGSTGGIDFNGAAVTPYTDYTSFFDVNAIASNGMGGWTLGSMDWKVVSLGDSNTLYLQATGNAVPEPGQTMAVLVVGGFLGGRVLRRRRTV
jgi:T5SS/PEP-CTERM-associated repeat protein